ncbi:PadR family transcriptional regulator [Halomarina rubra]|uniref:PadR family transcriptional regulator n=1 Tax=Halomarina rubra TaxID=2071873 RepID=A0ABD6AT46_9EURY|nr:PadR family transcriptional regulator [Halomarina rubra]
MSNSRSTGINTPDTTADTNRNDTDLTAFQRECLRVIAVLDAEAGDCYGLAIKRALEGRYGHEINHGRLYPNLDDLQEAGLVEKSALDKRTNEYLLTARGRGLLADAFDSFHDDLVAAGILGGGE